MSVLNKGGGVDTVVVGGDSGGGCCLCRGQCVGVAGLGERATKEIIES